MTFNFGLNSTNNLHYVHPDLVRVERRAIQLTTQDFAVYEGVRTPERQAEYLKRGVTKTLKSKHLIQPDGFGHAVDNVPWIDGNLRWEVEPCFHILAAVQQAARELGVKLVCGCVWDRPLNDLLPGVAGLKAEVENYKIRHPGPDFLDFPHIQLWSAP